MERHTQTTRPGQPVQPPHLRPADAAAPRSIYRTDAGRDRIRRWCTDQLDGWAVPHRRLTVATSLGDTCVISAGPVAPTVVLLPGTNFCAATLLALTAVLAQRWSVLAVDLPGQPGLSTGTRPEGGLPAYGRWLAEVLAEAAETPAIVVGHSVGGGIALASDSPRITGRVLVAPAGLVRLRVTPALFAATVPWLLHPTYHNSGRLLRRMHPPGHRPTATLGSWLTQVSRHCRSSTAPVPLPAETIRRVRDTPLIVAAGAHDPFLPPRRLRPATRRELGIDVFALPEYGHLVLDEALGTVAALVADLAARIG
ncbi:MAG TPA: alpha/beta hydrolase [Actinoplanes sp.]|nr:alpha/beta hydrolase [Actinoplanes sp.]